MAPGPTILVLSPSTGGYYFGALLTGIAREVARADGRIVLVQTLELGVRSDEIGIAPDFSTPVGWDEVDGVVSITSAAGADYLRRLQQAGTPVVVASNVLAGLDAPSAQPDNHGGTVAAVEHLLAHGHSRIGFVGNLAQSDITARHTAYRDTLRRHGLRADPAHLFRAVDNSEVGGTHAAEAFLTSASRPTALMVATDRNAVGLLRVLAAAGVDVPGEVAVIGFDNIEAAAYTRPRLTTVDQSFEDVGALATRLVLSMIRGEEVPCVPHTSPASVVARGSCGCATSRTDHGRRVTDDHRQDTLDRVRRRIPAGLPAEHAESLLGTVEQLALTGADAPVREIDRLVASVPGLVPRGKEQRRVIDALTNHARLVRPGTSGGPLLDALAHLKSAAFLADAGSFEAKLDEQSAVGAGLLDPVTSDPRDLAWLHDTHVRAAVLGLWQGSPSEHRLELVGVYDPLRTGEEEVGTMIGTRQFPPRSLVMTADPSAREITVVVPVRTREHDWGLLCVVGEIDTSSARETYHHWAALLASALEERGLQEAVRTSEERYALAARASKDGLWEMDLASELIFLSERCRDLLSLPGQDLLAADLWTDRVHPDDTSAVREAMATAMSLQGEPVEVEYRVRRPDGEHTWVLSRCLGVSQGSGPVTRLVGSLSDIHQRKELEEKLRRGALYDTVTGLPNRRLFLDRLTVAVAQRQRRSGAGFAVVFLDLDGFKLVNDSLGHLMGDELLRTVAERLRDDLRTVDTAARFGGDEFAVLLSDPVPDQVLVIAQRIQERIAEPIVLAGQEVSVTASVGIATSASGYADAEDVLRDADIAMYDAKGTERGSASVFDPAMHALASGRLRVRGELRTALAEEQFLVHYQPIVALDGAGVGHFEALVRWDHPDRGLLLPGAFLPAMEDSSSIVRLGEWVLDEVCRQISVWRDAYPGPVRVSVNASHREFWAGGFLRTVTEALERHRVPAECLVVEITESVIMSDLEDARRIMTELHDAGVRLHIDDFGTGQSSLNALRTLPVDALKIDGSFIREITEVERTTELVGIILHMGRVLGLDVIAECVETPAQADRLTTLGCASAQGWLYAEALPGAAAGSLLGTDVVGVGTSTPTDDVQSSVDLTA